MRAAVARPRPPADAVRRARPRRCPAWLTKCTLQRVERGAEPAEHRSRDHRLRRRDRRVAVAHHRAGDEAALDDEFRLDAEERRLPQHQIRQLADFDRSDFVRDAVRDRRVDRVFRDVAPDAQVVVVSPYRPASGTALPFHLVGGLPRPADHFADAPHRLRIGRHHADRAEVVQHVLGGNRLRTNPRIGKRHVLGHLRRQVMADHQHVEMLVQRVPRERHRRVGGRRAARWLAAETDDVGRVAAAGAFGVIRVNRAAVDRRDRVLDETGLVERVGVDRDLHVEFVGDRQALVDGRGRRAPVLVQLQADGAGADLLAQRFGASRCCPCRESRNSAGTPATASYIRRMFHAPGVQVVALVPVAGPVPPPMSVVSPE